VAEGLAEIPMRAVDGARDPGQVVAAFLFGLLLMIVLFGLIWGVVAVSSQRLKLGLYTSQEVFPKRWQVEGLEDYAAQTTGFQAGFYLFPGADLELRTSVGYVNAQAVQDDRTYNLHGVESRAAFGYSPFNGTGPMLMAEVHTKQFDRGPIRDYLARNVAPTLPAVRRTTAITAGWTLAF
jgi:hypothetical protein